MATFPSPLRSTATPPIELRPGRGGPLLLSVPHSGRDYPPDLIARSRLGRASLEQLEDPLVDLLVEGAIDCGTGAVIARAPRAMIDVNRAEAELHPRAIRGRHGEPPTPRARAGLGLIPTRLAGLGDLWRGPIDQDELDWRLHNIHRPYHAAVAERLEELSRRHSDVLLLDCHSMPPRSPGEANVVIGDRHGTSSAPWLVDAAEAIGRQLGFVVTRNSPFAGGHVIERHGEPGRGIHAIQIEIDRAAYCQRDARTPGHGFDRVAHLFEALVAGLATLIEHRQRDFTR